MMNLETGEGFRHQTFYTSPRHHGGQLRKHRSSHICFLHVQNSTSVASQFNSSIYKGNSEGNWEYVGLASLDALKRSDIIQIDQIQYLECLGRSETDL